MLLEEAIRRGLEKSDSLLMFTLKALNPERYDESLRREIFKKEKDAIGPRENLSIEDIRYSFQEDPYIKSIAFNESIID